MAPPAMAFLGGVAVATAAVSGVSGVVKDVKETVENLVLNTCDKCQAKVTNEGMEAHLAKHREDEDAKQEMDRKWQAMEDAKQEMARTLLTMEAHLDKLREEEDAKQDMERKLHALELKVQELTIKMQDRELSILDMERSRQQELANLRAQMEFVCEECGQTVHVREFRIHENIHRKDHALHSRHEDEKSAMREDHHKRGTNRTKSRK